MSGIIRSLRAFLLGALVFGFTGLAHGQANGHNATLVELENGQKFQLMSNGTWRALDRQDQHTFTYSEVRREAWSIFLRDRARDMDVELDLFAQEVFAGHVGEPLSYVMTIVGSSADVTGTTAKLVEAEGFAWAKEGNDWLEMNPKGEILYRFKEASRDIWSIRLLDVERSVELHIDLKDMKIRLSWPGQELFDFADIQAAA